MTYREKLLQERPERVNPKYSGGCFGCPGLYEYPFEPCNLDDPKDADCRACWDKEMPKEG